MRFRLRVLNILAAACVVAAPACMFIGRMLTFQLTRTSGSFLERVAANADAWDLAHRWMLVGAVAAIGAAIALAGVLRQRAGGLADAAAALVIVGAAAAVGQYALDFVMLVAAQTDPPSAGAELVGRLRANNVLDFAFYQLPKVAGIGQLLFALALWKQGPRWRLEAAVVSLAVAILLSDKLLSPSAPRMALGLLSLGYVGVAWKMLTDEKPSPVLPEAPRQAV